MVQRFRSFLDEAWSELKKVSWPTREQTRNLTALVLALSLVVGIYISVFDFVFAEIVRLLNTSLG